MNNLRIVATNRVDTDTLTAVPDAESGHPASYLANSDRGLSFRSSSLASQEIHGTSATASTVSCVVLWRHNLTSAATIRFRGYTTEDWTGAAAVDTTALAAYTSGLFDDWDYCFSAYYLTPVSGIKSYTITIADAANPDGYFEVGRLVVGAHSEAQYNPQYGLTLGWVTNSEQLRRPCGTLDETVGAQWRSLTFDMMVATEAYRAVWAEIGRKAAAGGEFWLSVFPESTEATEERDHAMLGKFMPGMITKLSGWQRYDFSITLNEV